MSLIQPLPQSFYAHDTLAVARGLLGKTLVRLLDGDFLTGKIIETEAYIGEDDPACHAARGRTQRTGIMYGPPGFAYIYFIYGMYYCLNAVTEASGFPAAVLIRAVEPLKGIETMKRLRGVSKAGQLASGPGKLCQAFALDRALNGTDLTTPPLFIAGAPALPDVEIGQSSRIGIRVGQAQPWRFFVRNHHGISHPNHR